MKIKFERYNATKKRALKIFADQKWMDVFTFAQKAGIRPVRRAYTYLLHLDSMGLVQRGADPDGKLHYQITPRGLARLKWLSVPKKPDVIQSLAASFLRSVTKPQAES